MQAQGTKISFETTASTDDELENCLHVELTSKQEWNPGTVKLGAINSNESRNQFELLDILIRDTHTSTERDLNANTELLA